MNEAENSRSFGPWADCKTIFIKFLLWNPLAIKTIFELPGSFRCVSPFKIEIDPKSILRYSFQSRRTGAKITIGTAAGLEDTPGGKRVISFPPGNDSISVNVFYNEGWFIGN